MTSKYVLGLLFVFQKLKVPSTAKIQNRYVTNLVFNGEFNYVNWIFYLLIFWWYFGLQGWFIYSIVLYSFPLLFGSLLRIARCPLSYFLLKYVKWGLLRDSTLTAKIFTKCKSDDIVTNLLLLILYPWEAYNNTDINGLLVLVSVQIPKRTL